MLYIYCCKILWEIWFSSFIFDTNILAHSSLSSCSTPPHSFIPSRSHQILFSDSPLLSLPSPPFSFISQVPLSLSQLPFAHSYSDHVTFRPPHFSPCFHPCSPFHSFSLPYFLGLGGVAVRVLSFEHSALYYFHHFGQM